MSLTIRRPSRQFRGRVYAGHHASFPRHEHWLSKRTKIGYRLELGRNRRPAFAAQTPSVNRALQSELDIWVSPVRELGDHSDTRNILTDDEFEDVTRKLSGISRGRLSRWTPDDSSHEELYLKEAESDEDS